jgi:8-amino-7-oxononanoate synthase
MEEGLFIQAIRPPTVAEGSARLRITLMATHTKDDLTGALEALGRAGKRYNLI